MGSGAPIRTIGGQPLAGVAVAAPIMAMQSADDMLFGMSSQSRAAVAIGSTIQTRRAPVSIARGPYWGADCHSQWPAEPAGAMVWAEAADATRVAAARLAKSIFFIVKSNLIRVFRRMRGSVVRRVAVRTSALTRCVRDQIRSVGGSGSGRTRIPVRRFVTAATGAMRTRVTASIPAGSSA